ncbi:MAG: DDE-type integrase/transposase/recombinase [Rhodothermales bacterium]|nr:DDE-type integrase/transposase/recombinase [Rhodothermales bacterium]
MSRAGFTFDPEWLAAARAEWKAAPRFAKGPTLDRLAAQVGCSPPTLYRAFAKKGGKTKTVKRDKVIPDSVILEGLKIKERGRALSPDGRELPTRIVLEKLRERLPEGTPIPSVTTFNSRGQELGYRERRRYRRLVADHALQQVQCDWSRSEYFQLFKTERSGQVILRVSGQHYAYKDNNRALRTWIVAVKDAFSGLYHAEMITATGENYVQTLDFLHRAWDDADESRAFRHAPTGTLQMDRGPCMKAEGFKEAIRALGIEPVESQEKQANGKIENAFRQIWRSFELDLAEELGQGQTLTMADYNALLRRFCIEEGEQRPHATLRGLSRANAYRASLRQHPPRVLESAEDLFRLAFTVTRRTIDQHGFVSLGGVAYRTPEHVAGDDGRRVSLAPGTELDVMRNLHGQVVARLADRYSEVFALDAAEATVLGTYTGGSSATLQQRLREDVDVRLPGSEALARQFDTDAPRPRILPHDAAPLVPVTPFEAAPAPQPAGLSETDARTWLGRRLAPHGLTLAHLPARTYAGLTPAALEAVVADALRQIPPAAKTGS